MLNTDSAIYEEAKNWINTLAVGNLWNVQLLQQKYRVDRDTGKRRALPFRIRRYAEGCPPSCMKKAIEVLLDQAPYEGIVFRGERLEGKYRPTKTEWSYDSRDATNPAAGRNDGTFTLVQDLVDDDFPDTETSLSGGSCSEEVVSEWHWGESSVEDIPLPVPAGWSYAIQAVSRDGDDGTFSYVLVKRHALTQHLDETVVEDTRLSRKTVEQWNNLYKDGEGGWKDHDGNAVVIPGEETGPGFTVRTTPRLNQDCTVDMTIERTEIKPELVDVSTSHTQFIGDHTVRRVGSDSPLGPAPDSGGGIIKTHKDTLQPDGRFTTEESTRRERPVSQAVVDYAVGRRGRRVTIEHRYQSAPALPPASSDVGHRTRSEKTDGKLYNVTEVTWDTTRKTPVEHRCEVDQYKHVDSDTTAGESSVDHDVHVLSQGGRGGHVYSVSFAMDDEGAVTKTVNDHLERPVSSSRESWAVTRTGTRHTVVDTQVPTPAAAPAGSPSTLGRRVTVEKTPGGLYNNTVEETVLDPGMDGAATGASCSKTVFIHRHDASSVDSEGVAEDEHVVDAGGGHYQTRRAVLNDDSTRSVDTTDTYELPRDSASVDVRTTVKAVVTTRTDRNVQDAERTAHELGRPGASKHTVNDGGSWDYTETTATAVTGNHDRAACERTVFEHSHSTQTVALASTADETDAPAPGGGHYYQKTSQVDDTGVRTDTVTDSLEIHRSDYARKVSVTPRFTVVTTTEKNCASRGSDPTSPGKTVQSTLNRGGTYDVTVTTASVNENRDRAECEKTIFYAQDTKQTDVRLAAGVDPDLRGDVPDVQLLDGQYATVRENVDENGVLTRTVTVVDELPLDRSKVARTATHFTRSYNRTDANTPDAVIPQEHGAAVDADGYDGITSETFTVNNGGSVTVQTSVDIPVARSWWDPEVNGHRAYRACFHFRNFTSADVASEWAAFNSKVSGDYAQWKAQEAEPTGFGMQPDTRLNDFGLLDGTFVATAAWSPDAAAPGEPENVVFTDKVFHSYSVHQQPYRSESGTGGSGGATTRIYVSVTHQKFRLVIGRGLRNWDNLCAANQHILEGSTFSFTPSTKAYNARIVTDLDTVRAESYETNKPIHWRPDQA